MINGESEQRSPLVNHQLDVSQLHSCLHERLLAQPNSCYRHCDCQTHGYVHKLPHCPCANDLCPGRLICVCIAQEGRYHHHSMQSSTDQQWQTQLQRVNSGSARHYSLGPRIHCLLRSTSLRSAEYSCSSTRATGFKQRSTSPCRLRPDRPISCISNSFRQRVD